VIPSRREILKQGNQRKDCSHNRHFDKGNVTGLRFPAMNTALRRAGDKTEIEAADAAAKSITRAVCPDCGETVNLHV
jgi:hypothetical protein